MITQTLSRILFLCLILLSWGAQAAATAISVAGDVKLTPKGGAIGALAEGQRIDTGADIKTGSNSGVTLRFDDGQLVALTSNSNFVVDEYRFNPHKPAEGSFVSSLLRGGLRSVTGLIGKANPAEVKVKTDVATIGIRGTDFQLFYDGRLFMSVREGAIGSTNTQGEAIFEAARQSLGVVPDAQSKPRVATLTEFPTDAVASMRRLDINPDFGTRRPNPNDPTCADRR